MSFWEHYFAAVLFTGIVAVPVYFWTVEVPRRNREDERYWREQWPKKYEEEKKEGGELAKLYATTAPGTSSPSSYPFAK